MSARRCMLGLLCGMAGLAWAGERSDLPPRDLRTAGPSFASYSELKASVKDGRYDVAALKEILRNPEVTRGLRPNEERAVLNEVMDSLRRSEDAGSPLEDLLMAVALGPDRDPGVREYAVQHLLLWHAKTERKAKVEDCLWKCTEDSALSAGAILQLHHLATRTKGGLSRPLAPALLASLARPKLRNSERITLLLVAAESGVPDALPYARNWADEATDRVLLSTSLTAIGKLGGPEDLAFLTGLENRRNMDDVRKTLESARARLGAGTVNGGKP